MTRPIFYHITCEHGGIILNLAEATSINISQEHGGYNRDAKGYYLHVNFKNGDSRRIFLAVNDEMEAQEYLRGMFRYLKSEMARD